MHTATTPAQTPADCVLQAVQADPAPAAEALGITPQQAANLAHLAAHLRASYPSAAPALNFTMSMYHHRMYNGLPTPEEELQALLHRPPAECGSVACAVGHGPSSGLRLLPGEGWGQYRRRVFGVPDTDLPDLFPALFCSGWAKYDDTPRGAAARICYALQHGAAALRPPNPGADHDVDANCNAYAAPAVYQEYVA